jgi:hypothetical protein
MVSAGYDAQRQVLVEKFTRLEVELGAVSLLSHLDRESTGPARPIHFKRNVVDMPLIEVEFGLPVERALPANGESVSGIRT